MAKVYFFPDGKPSILPPSKELAIKLKKPYYGTQEHCPKCNATGRLVSTDECLNCRHYEEHDFYNRAVIPDYPVSDEILAELAKWEGRTDVTYSPMPCKAKGHYGVLNELGKCAYCAEEKELARQQREAKKRPAGPSPRKKALMAGKKWYTPTTPCPHCGTLAERRVDNGQCKGCVPTKESNPRQEALNGGQEWYEPLFPCFKCNTRSPRNVKDDTCLGCEYPEYLA